MVGISSEPASNERYHKHVTTPEIYSFGEQERAHTSISLHKVLEESEPFAAENIALFLLLDLK